MLSLQRAIERQVHRLLGEGEAGDAVRVPVRASTSPPLFPPTAVCRAVHADFTTMLVGGMSGLLVQMLHPGALAGVWDHSNFRADMAGRLRRTAQFISATTYGSQDDAARLIGRVRTIHDRVHGRLPDGTLYSANDPALLTWVHIAGASSFLEAYRRYRAPGMSARDQDRYFAETAEVARALGANDVPESRRAAATYLRALRPSLRCDERTREVAAALFEEPAPSLALLPFRQLVIRAAIDLLPDWAAAMHGLSVPVPQRPAIRLGLSGVAAVTRWALAR
ncbi:DUF2236 domain-containing protein [Sphingomonas parva]|uniref:DUF2236 domain-containing protein n=1 Tax=Sphingomonas parva TaxID=2555898 RepID=A0A4Y8ZW21_9SPHN|nr:oxygenase MpaB family protein [Sphingomonas parva]TFI58636.1 DUF2236 domain-containing protein [Sphingomonas parva]